MLDPMTTEVRRLTVAAVAASSKVTPTLTVRCSQCKGSVGHAAMTSAGPFFTSSWTVQDALGFEVVVGGRTLNRRQAVRYRDQQLPVATSSGSPIANEHVDGLHALLALPPGVGDDYPALLVRCDKHGDAVLDRLELLAALRRDEPSFLAALSWPLTPYQAPDSTWLEGGRTQHQTETRKIAPRKAQ